MSLKKVLIILGLLLVTATVLVACGGGDTATPDGAEATGGHQIVERGAVAIHSLQDAPVARQPAQILARPRPALAGIRGRLGRRPEFSISSPRRR